MKSSNFRLKKDIMGIFSPVKYDQELISAFCLSSVCEMRFVKQSGTTDVPQWMITCQSHAVYTMNHQFSESRLNSRFHLEKILFPNVLFHYSESSDSAESA